MTISKCKLVEWMPPPGKRVGVFTISAASLSKKYLEKAGCARDTPIAGAPEGGEFSTSILDNASQLDVEMARREKIDAAARFATVHSELGVIV